MEVLVSNRELSCTRDESKVNIIPNCRLEMHVSHLEFMSYHLHMRHTYICMNIYICININVHYTPLYCIFHCLTGVGEETEKELFPKRIIHWVH